MTSEILSRLDHDQVEVATRLMDNSIRSRGLSKRELREALQRGLGYALHHGHPARWGNDTTDRSGNASGRLLLRIANELMLPLSGPIEPNALSVAEELLG